MKAALLQWKFTMMIRALLPQEHFKRFWKERSRKRVLLFRVIDLSLLYIMLRKAGNDLYPSSQTRAHFSLSFKRYFRLELETRLNKRAPFNSGNTFHLKA